MPVPTEIRINRIEIVKINIGDKTVDVKADVTIANNGKLLDLNSHRIKYHLALREDLGISDGGYNSPISVKPMSETRVEIPVTVNMNRLVKSAWKCITNDGLPYHIDVKAQLDENSFYHTSTSL